MGPPEFRLSGSIFTARLSCLRPDPRQGRAHPPRDPAPAVAGAGIQLHPLVPPQVLHFMQVPLRTSV